VVSGKRFQPFSGRLAATGLSMALDFDLHFDPAYGEPIPLFAGVARLTANNPGPFTFHGTNSYLVGQHTLAIIDPGPESDDHYDALLRAIAGRPVSHIFVSHTHRDHSPLAARLKQATGALVCAEGPHRPARPLRAGETGRLAGADTDFSPDMALADNAVISGDGWTLRTVLTPGHTANHAAFALEGTGLLFSGDHVMAWSTTIVAPPDGNMPDYMASLDRLIQRDDRILLPGHGGPVTAPRSFLLGLKDHRKMRELAIIERLRQGDHSIAEMVKAIYRDTDPRLHKAAELSVLAHLEDLVARRLVETAGAPSIGGIFRPI
jgi:glyoxylase-like metal-dependent hydrolase (beta-lactamase superfamily II)